MSVDYTAPTSRSSENGVQNQQAAAAFAAAPVPAHAPSAPPPSLASTVSSVSRYSRDVLMSLVRTPGTRAPAPDRLRRFTPILRGGSLEWGVDDDTIMAELDGEPISKAMPIPVTDVLFGSVGAAAGRDPSAAAGAAATSSTTSSSDILFRFNESRLDDDEPRPAAPILISFTNPDPFKGTNGGIMSDGGIVVAGSGRKASAAFQSFPASVSSSTSSLGLACSLGREYNVLRSGRCLSRSSSISSMSSTSSSSLMMVKGRLNPFAAPFPLPATASHTEIPVSNLPEPKSLPKNIPSLPQRPNACLPPVFVKRESAALPQPMALPNVAPMGHDWEGENSLSGNAKRRRASQLGLGFRPISFSGHSPSNRPERLVQLGRRLRESIS